MKRNKYIIWSIIGLIFILFYFNILDHLNLTKDQYAEVLYSLMLLAFLCFGFFSKRISFSYIVKSAICWVGIFIFILVGYSYRSNFVDIYNNVVASINPSKAQLQEDGSVEIEKSLGGQYKVDAIVSGKKINFLVDTGASSVTLAPQDALRLGVDINALNYNVVIYTANGVNKAAFVRLPYVQIGSIRINNVKALVARKGLNSSLLGMSFLNRLDSFSFDDGKLAFRG